MKMEGFKMIVKQFKSKDLLSTKLFSTKKHSYTIGDMISLFSFMILLSAFVYISLIIGIK